MDYDIERLNKSKWWERFLLLFRPSHSIEEDSYTTLEYKILFGEIFVTTITGHQYYGGDNN